METTRLINNEFDSLWQNLAELKRVESDVAKSSVSASSARAGEIIALKHLQAEIESRFGFFPPFYGPALENPKVLESLWRQQVSSYHENPLPKLFKEKLAARCSRFCASPYFIVTHSCLLHHLGMTADEIAVLLEKPAPATNADIDRIYDVFSGAPHPLDVWPEDNSPLEESLISYCILLFLGMKESEQCTDELRELLGSSSYSYLVAFLASIKTAHLWAEAHPEISYEDHQIVQESYLTLVRKEPHLLELFQNYKETIGTNAAGLESQKRLQESEDRYRELFENASDIIYTQDFGGKLLSINRAIERITGYSRDEALQMNIKDIIAPEYLPLAKRMVDSQNAGEIPLNYELEILSKDGKRIALGINTRPIFRGGKVHAVQGIARDITTRKKTEAALQEANRKLEAWVSELEERTREMTLLNEMGDILRACLTTEEAYSVIVRAAQQIFPVQVGALYIIAPSRNLVESVAVWGNQSLAERSFSPQECWALRRGRTHWVENARSGLICRHIHHSPEDGYLCIPMMAQSEAIGVLHLMQPEHTRMTETKQRMAVTMSEHIAMALSNLRLHETLRSQSIRDPLTGLFNRRFMEESLELEIRRASRNQRPLGMIMIDLDHFKFFNDNFGHEAGDLLLKELGMLLKGNIRGEDIACRFGGEEFTLILPEGNRTVTQQRAEFLREAIRRLDVQYRSRPLGKLTASMGVAVFPDHGRTAKALIEAADKALYRSKSDGRDRVTIAT